MSATVYGSQTREKLSDTGMSISGIAKHEVLLWNPDSKKHEVWAENDHCAGYVVEIWLTGWEFCREADKADIKRLAFDLYK